MTAQGHPRAIFKRAIERGNVVIAEATAREIGLSLEEALELVLLYAAYEPASSSGQRCVRLLHRRGRGVAAESAARAVRVGELRAGEREAGAKLLSELARR